MSMRLTRYSSIEMTTDIHQKHVAMLKTMIVFFSAMLMASMANNTLVAQHDQLLAPPPPDAIVYKSNVAPEEADIPSLGFTVAFHSPLPVREVVAFYNRETGEMEEVEPGVHYRSTLLEVTVKQLGVLKVYDIPRNPGVRVQDIRQMSSRHCSSEYFRPFRDMYNSLDQYSRNDFRAVCEQYGFIDHAYFGLSDQTAYDGRQMTRDEVLYREYTKELDEERGEMVNLEEMMEEAQRLMQQGRMDEATALFQKIAEVQQQAVARDMERAQTMQRRKVEDRWDEWLGFLDELVELMYPTIVHIDYHPSHWPDDDWLHESIEW